MEGIVPSRSLNLLYIILDSVFLVVLVILLLIKKKRMTVAVGLFGGILYFIVDYVFFYHVSHSRTVYINGAEAGELETALYLLWHELSSGFTNFALIWICLSRQKDWKLWVALVVGWWFLCPAIAALGGEATIQVARTTTAYHGAMAIIMAVGYLGLLVYDLFFVNEKRKPVNILYLFLIGFFVQFAWESAFLLYGIRPWNDNSLQTLFIDSLIETNLGMPYFYVIHLFLTRRVNEDFSLVNGGSRKPIEEDQAA